MSTKLTLTIDKKIISEAKQYAKAHGRSLSNLIEDYLHALVEEPGKQGYETSFSPLVRSLKGAITLPSQNADYKKLLEDELLRKYLS